MTAVGLILQSLTFGYTFPLSGCPFQGQRHCRVTSIVTPHTSVWFWGSASSISGRYNTIYWKHWTIHLCTSASNMIIHFTLKCFTCSPQLPLIKVKPCFFQEQAALTHMYQLQCVLDVFIHQVGNTANTTEGFQILFLETSPSMA